MADKKTVKALDFSLYLGIAGFPIIIIGTIVSLTAITLFGGFLMIGLLGFNVAMLYFEIRDSHNGWFLGHLLSFLLGGLGVIVGIIFYYVILRKRILAGKVGQEVDDEKEE